MGDGPEQVGAHFFFFGHGKLLLMICQDTGLPFEVGGGSAHQRRNDQHPKKRNRVSVQQKIQMHIWISEKEINAQDTENRCDDPKNIFGGVSCDQHHGHDIDKGYINNIAGDMIQKIGQQSSQNQKKKRNHCVMDRQTAEQCFYLIGHK